MLGSRPRGYLSDVFAIEDRGVDSEDERTGARGTLALEPQERTVAEHAQAGGAYAPGSTALALVAPSLPRLEDHEGLFAFQGEQILRQPLVIALLAVPIVIQVYFNSALAYALNRRFGVAHCVAGPSALIGASNFFELAVAAAISLFGFESGAALATVVGVLVEVPVMLSVVAIVNRSRQWYSANGAPA